MPKKTFKPKILQYNGKSCLQELYTNPISNCNGKGVNIEQIQPKKLFQH
jgi:hypothetical protein